MAIKVCPNGHHYNTDDNPTCPYCDKANSDSNFEWSEVDFTMRTGIKTEALQNDGNEVWTGKTEIISSKNYSNSNSRREDDFVWPGATMPISTIRKKDEENQIKDKSNDEYQHQPVVGWLVCIEGPDKGKDFILRGAKSTIGRRDDSSVPLSDPKISRDGFPALIVYDDRKSHKFYLASGDASARNNVELCDNMLLGQSVINPYDEIRIEDTVLVFVPFCGDEFFWKEN